VCICLFARQRALDCLCDGISLFACLKCRAVVDCLNGADAEILDATDSHSSFVRAESLPAPNASSGIYREVTRTPCDVLSTPAQS
jgi:hypothetical protein